jgi:hypothetical protein
MIDSTHTASLSTDDIERALERFDWIADDVRDQAHCADVEALAEVLARPGARTSAKERAMVTLAFVATARAEAALRWFDADGAHARLKLLCQLALSECARRRHQRRESSKPRLRKAA